MSESGQLFVFEGADGAGKTTLARALVDHWNAHQIACDYQAFPGREKGTLGHHVYQVHHDPGRFNITSISPTSLQLLHIAAHLDAIDTMIMPALRRGRHVVLDRFWWSTWVYGMIASVDPRTLEVMLRLEQEHWGAIKPSMVFLVKRPTPINRDEPLDQWDQLWINYQHLAEGQANRYPIRTIDNSRSVNESMAQLLEHIDRSRPNTTQGAPSRQRSALRSATVQKQAQLPLGNGDTANLAAPVSPPPTFSRLAPAVPSRVYDTYWRFAAERQAIFMRRFAGKPAPWTTDPILVQYKFTNAYRASDRVSQYLIRNVIYQGDQSPTEIFFRILLFKLFNRIETWELLTKNVGPITYESFSFDRYDRVLSRAMATGTAIFSAAYIMPSGRGDFRDSKKHRSCLRLLELMMADEVPLQIQDARSMRQVFELLHSYPLIGDFLAYQFAIDINYSTVIDFSEMEFVMPGPGAKSGIRKCFGSLGGLTEADIIRVVTERQEEEFARLDIRFASLWGRHLQLIDCQNLFCEVDKYARIAHPDVAGLGDRNQIKQKYRPTAMPIEYWYPPKWGLNHRIQGGERQ